MTMDVTDAINASGSWTTINWVRIPTVAQMGGSNSSTIMAMAQCRFRVCHATARGGALDPHCPTGNGIGGSPDYMDLCSRVSHDDGRTWGPLATNVTGGLWAGMIASGAEARNDTDGRSADPNLLWDAKRSKMLLFFDTRNPNQTSWVTSSSDGVQWAPATRVNTGYNTVCTPSPTPLTHIAGPASNSGLGDWGQGPGTGATQLTMGPHKDRVLVAAYGNDLGVWYSDDLTSWSRSTMPLPNASKEGLTEMCEPQLVELSNGTVRLEMRHCASKPGWPHNSRGYALSTDGGLSFGSIIPSGMSDGGSQGQS
eukprot:COSAG04_NODE_471_length_13830_cov_4.905251_4_plen_311_part_00